MAQPTPAAAVGTRGARPRVIALRHAPGHRQSWDRPIWVVALWAVCEALLVTNPVQPSSAVRAAVLRAFGARIGAGAVLRPRLRVRFPWKLQIGADSWVGEDVWLHNQDQLQIGRDCVLSQGTFVTTGSHAYADDMALITRPVVIEDGAWVTARCVVLAGSRIGVSALVLPATVVRGDVPAATLFGGNPGAVVGPRFGRDRS